MQPFVLLANWLISSAVNSRLHFVAMLHRMDYNKFNTGVNTSSYNLQNLIISLQQTVSSTCSYLPHTERASSVKIYQVIQIISLRNTHTAFSMRENSSSSLIRLAKAVSWLFTVPKRNPLTSCSQYRTLFSALTQLFKCKKGYPAHKSLCHPISESQWYSSRTDGVIPNRKTT